jgi:hypothetical protein
MPARQAKLPSGVISPRGKRMARRVQLQRTKGWRMPPNTRKVDRSTIFGNPFNVAKYGPEEALLLHRAWLTGAMTDEEIAGRYSDLVATHLIDRRRQILRSLPGLRGMNLACWCSPTKACHADLLLELAHRM